MKNNRTNKPTRNFQKKKYYTNRNMPNSQKEPKEIYYYDPLKREWHQRIIK